MMEPANLRNGDDPATWWGFDDSGLGTVVVERLVWPRGVVVGTVGPQESAEMGLAQDEAMIQALAAREPMTRSTNGFCQGARGAMRTSRIPIFRLAARTPRRRSCLDHEAGISEPNRPGTPR